MYFFKEEYSIIKKVLLRDNSSKRIGIARLLNNPQIHTLEDEISNGDQTTEAKIINNLIKSKNIKLLITIAYRRVAAQTCGLLLFFKNEKT